MVVVVTGVVVIVAITVITVVIGPSVIIIVIPIIIPEGVVVIRIVERIAERRVPVITVIGVAVVPGTVTTRATRLGARFVAVMAGIVRIVVAAVVIVRAGVGVRVGATRVLIPTTVVVTVVSVIGAGAMSVVVCRRSSVK